MVGVSAVTVAAVDESSREDHESRHLDRTRGSRRHRLDRRGPGCTPPATQVIVCGRTPRDAHRAADRTTAIPSASCPGPVRTDPETIDATRRRGAARGQGHPDRGRGGLAGTGCATRTPWCARCRTGSSRSSASARFCPDVDRRALPPCGSPPRHSPRAGCGCALPVRLVLPDDRGRDATGRGAARPVAARSNAARISSTDAWRKLLTNAVAGLMVFTGRKSGMFRRDDIARLARLLPRRMPRGGASRGREPR